MDKEEFRNKIENAIGFDELENLSFKTKRKLEKRCLYQSYSLLPKMKK